MGKVKEVINKSMIDGLKIYKEEMRQELENILAYWMQHTIDERHGGFYGKIDHNNTVHSDSPKGSVMNSRILWAFSAVYRYSQKEEYLLIADRAYHYIIDFFLDKEYGGLYWTVDYTGKPLDKKKQIYALSFAIYGLSEYYQCRQYEETKDYAVELYNSIVRFSYDTLNGGYLEAFTQDWQEIQDLRLSAKDANEKKSMNTHLHVLEAFTNLFRIWPDEKLKIRIAELIQIFLTIIIDPVTNHLILFFDEDWRPKSEVVSYGHDIEAAWLVQEASEVIDDKLLLDKVKTYLMKTAFAALRGLDKDGGLWYEKHISANHLIKEKHWWPQAEAMIGFFNAWQNTNDRNFLEHSYNSWKFIRDYMLDKNGGEWYWGVKEDYSIMIHEDKVGLWKSCYHNTRACLEIIRRIEL